MQILKTPITRYNSVFSTTGQASTLGAFIAECQSDETRRRSEEIRSKFSEAERKQLKLKRPVFSLSGLFENGHENENLTKHSGLVCVDVDHIEPEDVPALKLRLASMNCAVYVSTSVSGRGSFAIMRIAHPDKHKEQFEALRQVLKAQDIELDTKCMNVARLRICSYDNAPYFRPDAVPFVGINEPKRLRVEAATPQEYTGDMEGEIEQLIAEAEERQINVIVDNKLWLPIGYALCSLDDQEKAREWLHRIASLHPTYDQNETERHYRRVKSSSDRSAASNKYTLKSLRSILNAALLPDTPKPEWYCELCGIDPTDSARKDFNGL